MCHLALMIQMVPDLEDMPWFHSIMIQQVLTSLSEVEKAVSLKLLHHERVVYASTLAFMINMVQ